MMESHIDENETIDLLARLIRTNSANPPGNELAIAQVVAARFEELGIRTILQPISDSRANVIGILDGDGTRQSLLFSAHLDTVPPGAIPWQHDPLGADIDGDRMFGLGASDMKSGAAAMMAAACALVRANAKLKGNLVLGFTIGEEVDFIGARQLLAAGHLRSVQAIVVSEPTNLKLVTATKGVLWIKITTHGKAAHGSMPSEGVNAVLHMHILLDRLLKANLLHGSHPLLSQPSMTVTTMEGGGKTNVVPSRCVMTLDIRTLPPQRHDLLIGSIEGVMQSLQSECPQFNAELEILLNYDPMSTSCQEPIVAIAQATASEVLGMELKPVGVNFATEASLYSNVTGIPAIVYGPGDESVCHQKDEYVRISNVIHAARFYAGLARRVLG